MSDLARDLTPKQLAFAKGILRGLSPAEAAIAAGYSSKTAANTGYKLMQNPKVLAYIAEQEKLTDEASTITRADLITELAKIAFSDIRELMTWGTREIAIEGSKRKVEEVFLTPIDSTKLTSKAARAVSEVKLGKSGFSIKMHDKQGAIDKIARMIGAYEEDNKQQADALAALVKAAQGTSLPIGGSAETNDVS